MTLENAEFLLFEKINYETHCFRKKFGNVAFPVGRVRFYEIMCRMKLPRKRISRSSEVSQITLDAKVF